MDRTKRDPEVESKLFTLQISYRVGNYLCIFCGEALRSDELGACTNCKEQRRLKRIAECGYDWMEEAK